MFGNYELPAADDSLTKGISLPESFSPEDFSLVNPSLSKTDRIDSLMQDPAGRKFDDYYQPYDVLGKLEQPTIDFDATYGPSPDLDEALTKAGTRPSILQSINMAGAAITITVLTLAAVNTLGIVVDFPTAVLLSVIAAVSACGSSGVAGGSLLLIPLACSLFNIPNEVAMQVVAVGFIVGVLQDSAETALNSSTDVLFTAAACERAGGQ